MAEANPNSPATKRRRIAETPGRQPGRALFSWLRMHGYSLLSSLGRISRRPVASAMTIAVLGIALSLPAALYVAIDNLQRATQDITSRGSIAVFLNTDANAESAERLRGVLAQNRQLQKAQTVSPQAALAEFRKLAGFGEALDALSGNPLPWVVNVDLADADLPLAEAEQLISHIKTLPDVDSVQFDRDWLIRLQAVTDAIQSGVDVVTLLFAVAVVLIIGNTIRMEVEARRAEIEVVKLVGGTDAFVGRPFLYAGMWYGLAAGGLSAGLLQAALLALQSPIARVAAAYASSFVLLSLDAQSTAWLVGGGACLGWLGAIITVKRELIMIQPRE